MERVEISIMRCTGCAYNNKDNIYCARPEDKECTEINKDGEWINYIFVESEE